MKKIILLSAGLAMLGGGVSAADIVSTPAYRWTTDSMVQGEYHAVAPDPHTIISTYKAQPHYFMPVEQEWHLKNDISAYPQLVTGNTLHAAIYNMGLDEMVNAVEPDNTLRTGKEWAGVWTRDVSYSILLSMAYLQPEASKESLRRKVNANGRIIQDTGSGGAWPVSSDRMIWATAAWEIYKVTGDKEWLDFIYPVIKNSVEDDLQITYVNGGVNGETSFIDWREQSYPKWMQTADIYASQAQNTTAVHANALSILSEIEALRGDNEASARYAGMAAQLIDNMTARYWMDDKGTMAMYTYGRNYPILNPRSETLGQAFSILTGQLPAEMASKITANVPTTPYGVAIFYPQIPDMPAYHNNALWPFVASYWTLANASAGNAEGVLEGMGSVFRPAALFATNKENFNLDNGDIATELNSSNMLWSLAGNLALTHRLLFGITFTTDGLLLEPFVPGPLADERQLKGFPYRDATLDITVKGHGANVKSMTVNGVEQPDHKIAPDATGHLDVVIEMDNAPIPAIGVNHAPNAKAPLTPIARLSHDSRLDGKDVPVDNLLSWNPIEYIGHYIVLRDGERIAQTRQTTFDAVIPGEYQVIGVSGDGTEGFASEPVSNRQARIYEPLKENTKLTSPEVSYAPEAPIGGYRGSGFVELDHLTPPVTFKVKAPKAGRYAVNLRYANGNGPVNTENKCAVRTILVDGKVTGTVVMPQRGVANWDDWGLTNPVITELTAGNHEITVTYLPADENMNLGTNHAIVDHLILTEID